MNIWWYIVAFLVFVLVAIFASCKKKTDDSILAAQKTEDTSLETNDSLEVPKGIIGRYFEDSLPVIVRFVNELPESNITSKFPTLTVVSWKYNGAANNGMPLEDVNKRMIVLEGAIEGSMNSTGSFTHVYSRTGNNLKEFVYYSIGLAGFMTILNETLENHDKYPIEIHSFEDKDWRDFKRVLNDFKE